MVKKKLTNNISEFKIAVIDNNSELSEITQQFKTEIFTSQIQAYKKFEKEKFHVIINKVNSAHLDGFRFINKLKDTINVDTPYLLISKKDPVIYKKKILEAGVSDVYKYKDPKIYKRLYFLQKVFESKLLPIKDHVFHVKPNFLKRSIDIVISIITLLLALPIIIIVSIVLKLQNNGPIIYKSRRVATNFNIIGVFKFRTMIVDADEKINDIKDLNEYSNNSLKQHNNNIEKSSLYDDSLEPIQELDYLNEVRNTPVFLKFKADPRVTEFGKILRKTSIDELPQLFNILKGDMSLVGNRPIPILEGDRLTTDDSVARFLAPAGLTGYWQVTQRGTNSISQRDRIRMDNYYAKKRSFWFDFKIISRTFKALIQNENY